MFDNAAISAKYMINIAGQLCLCVTSRTDSKCKLFTN